jgi:hypothetical protein
MRATGSSHVPSLQQKPHWDDWKGTIYETSPDPITGQKKAIGLYYHRRTVTSDVLEVKMFIAPDGTEYFLDGYKIKP